MSAALTSVISRYRTQAIRPILMAVLVAGCFTDDPPTAITGGCKASDPECSAVPVMVTGGHQFTSLAAGRFHTCGLKSNGEAWCWGLNTAAQLGAQTPSTSSAVPVKVGGQTSFASVTAGAFHTCALAAGGVPYCWGNNSITSVLGVATVNDVCPNGPCSYTPVRAAGPLAFSALDAGATHNCALETSGAPQCWGYNVLGEVGSTSYGTAFSGPVLVPGGNTFSKVSSGFRFTCGLDSTGTLYCWGYGEEGQLGTLTIDPCTSGDGSFHCSAIPVAANTSLRFSAITTGTSFGCGLTASGVLYCWGFNGEGQLGTGDFNSNGAPVAVKTTGSWSSVAAGWFHACALRADGTAYCWGVNDTAQLGDGSAFYASTVPQPVSGGKTFVQIVGGSNHTCGLASDGTAWCWGDDAVKQLGRG